MSDDLTRNGGRRAGEVSTRKPYRPPTIVRYGDVTSLTRTGATGPKSDKGGSAKHRTT
jgi:hypothetical protein